MAESNQNEPSAPPRGPLPRGGLWKAGELARRAGLTRQALHQYITMGLLAPVELTKGGQRLFDSSAMDRIKLVRDLSASGYTLQDIREIFFEGKSAIQGPRLHAGTPPGPSPELGH